MGRLFFRIFLWFWFGTTCLLIVLIAGFFVLQPERDVLTPWRTIGRGTFNVLGSAAASAYEHEGEANTTKVLADFARDAHLRAWLYGPDGTLLGGPSPVEGAQDIVRRAFDEEEADGRTHEATFLIARRIRSSSGKDYVLLCEGPSRLGGRVFPLRLFLRLTSLVLTGGLVCLWLTWQITGPVRTLRSAARQFSRGDLAVRVSEAPELNRGDELSELARDFDDMATRIEELIKSQQQLLADISHELRSPLARMSLALDLARRRLGDGVPEHQRIEREVQRLNDLIEQLLTLARMQGRPNAMQSEVVNMRDLVHDVVDDAHFEAEANGRRVLVSNYCDVTVCGSRPLLRSAIENVVRNAVRHTAENTEVTIDMAPSNGDGHLTILVRDHGPGVPFQALDRLFDPFFRVEEARDRARGGVGLGLAIVRQAMLFHHGSASAQNHPDGGLLVRLELPAT